MQVTATKLLVVIAASVLLATCSAETLTYEFEEKNLLSEILRGTRDFSSSSTESSTSTSPGEESGCFYLGEMIAMESERVVRRRRETHLCYFSVFCDENGQVTEVEQGCVYDSGQSESNEEASLEFSSTPPEKLELDQ